MKIIQPTLESARLILSPFRPEDAPETQRLAGDRAIADTTLNIPHPYQDGVAEDWISIHRQMFEEGLLANFAIALRKNAHLVGAIGLRIDRASDKAELGYWIGRPYWNHGYCTEAAELVLDYGFAGLALNRIHAAHLARNPASGRVMEKLGMLREGTGRQHAKKWGTYEDLVFYGILNEEWARGRVRSGFENSVEAS
jgi:RimJ/RimL family protein N-acetyltransferase